MPEDPKAKQVVAKFDLLKSERMTWERNWQDIRDLVRPVTDDFQRKTTPGHSRVDSVYDGTAREAAKELAAALQSYMSSPTERWFGIQVKGDPEMNRDPLVLDWLEIVADEIFAQYANDATQFTSSIHEAYLDIAAFGNAIVNQEWNFDEGALIFRSHPVAACFYEEDKEGRVRTLYRTVSMTANQLIERFGKSGMPKEVLDEKTGRRFEVIHGVYPRDQRNPQKYTSTNMRFASCWVLREKMLVLSEGGYDDFPYHVARWSKVSDETYGRGPADDCLPDIRMLNRMEFTVIKAGQKAVDPPLTVPNDGFVMPIKTSPGSINFKEPGTEDIVPLEHRGNLPWGEEKCEQKRAFIRTCFWADWVRLMPKKERQTAYEVSELVEQQLRMMAPMLGRMQSELLRPVVVRSFGLLARARLLPPPPGILQGRKLDIVYQSGAARAQEGTKAVSMGRYLQELLPAAQVDPSVIDIIDFDQYATELARIRGVSRRILRSPEEVAAIRQQRQAQQQLAAAAQIAEPASQAVKNLSDAAATGNIF